MACALSTSAAGPWAAFRRPHFFTAAVFAFRPVLHLLSNPLDHPVVRATGSTGADILPPSTGLYVALASAAFMVAAGVYAHVGDDTTEVEPVEHSTPMVAGGASRRTA